MWLFSTFFRSLSWKYAAAAVSDKIFLFTSFFLPFFFLFYNTPFILVIFSTNSCRVSAHEGGAHKVEFLPTVKLSPSIT